MAGKWASLVVFFIDTTKCESGTVESTLSRQFYRLMMGLGQYQMEYGQSCVPNEIIRFRVMDPAGRASGIRKTPKQTRMACIPLAARATER